ncbi:MAG TPA: SAM-dependent methyltransferase [Chloroflexota bacterium]|nr:SAM-dependent methyltransferase [Chloroflexota bacterium]
MSDYGEARRARAGRPRLLAAIRAAIRAQGPIPFAIFMDLALYHPRYGYYSALRSPPGPRGDFYTSPEAHPAFGALLARQVLEVWERLGAPGEFTVEEWGAGSGRLASDILAAAPALAPEFGASLRYAIVERSPALRRAQQRLLRPWLDRVSWLEPPTPRVGAAPPGALGDTPREPEGERRGARGATPLVGCVLANELLDAFAVHRVVRRGDTLRELYVDLADQRDREAAGGAAFREREGPLSTPALADYFARLGLLPPEGAVAEVNLGALAWLRAVAARLARGALLVVDYAHPAEILYSARYPRGTLLAYYHHAISENPYLRVGYQDLTAHLDLTSLLLEGRAAGLAPLGLARQANFLRRLGLGAYEAAVRAADLPAAERQASLRALATLANPAGLGAYWVLAFGRGLGGPLHGLDEAAEPLSGPALPAFLRPRLGWS